MRIVYSVFFSVILNLILFASIILLIMSVPRSNIIKYEPLKVNLKITAPSQESVVVRQLGDLVKETRKVNTINPVLIEPKNILEKKLINLQYSPVIKKKSMVISNKLPKLVSKSEMKPMEIQTNITIKKKTLGEKILVGKISKQYFQPKNIGFTNLIGAKSDYEMKNIQPQSITKRTLNYNMYNTSIEKKSINFEDLTNMKGGNISFNNVQNIKQKLYDQYMQMVQNAVNNNLAFPSGKVTVEAEFYPDGLIKIINVYGDNSSPSLQNLLKTSVQNLSFVATKKVIMDITYNFKSNPGGLK